MAILSAKKLIKMARGWQKFAAMQRRKISFTRNGSDADGCSTSSSAIVEKCHFVVYTIDQIRYAFPLTYLENEKAVAVGDLHKALLLSIPSCCCATSSWQQESQNQQLLAYGVSCFVNDISN
ncbi:Auxin-responsive protein SAUR68 [Capsicum baccatum]|uniref:Auxin-responsive protein SAUR68 n=1 Tax=Capsicum baccatum TaxID=33114 RepID=A0A2G2VFJ7_CAPBA|nr:Auxin-responsive protein SAUR68 [Capsicum baccatum]